MKKLSIVCLAVVMAVAFGYGSALAESQSSSKAAAATSLITLIEQTDVTGSWHTILGTAIKVPEQKDLVFHVSLECGLFTDTLVKSKGGTKDTSTADVNIKVRVKLIDEDDNVTYANPNKDGGIVFASRSQELSARFGGILTDEDLVCTTNCVVDETTGETSCITTCTINDLTVEEEELQLILNTMNANAFNFLAPNLRSGVYTAEVEAEIDSSNSSEAGSADAWATIGLGSLIVDEIRMENGSDGSN